MKIFPIYSAIWCLEFPTGNKFYILNMSLFFTAAGAKWKVAAVKRLSVLRRSADYILVHFGSLSPFWMFWKSIAAKAGARGRMKPRKLHCCIWRVLIKPNLPFLFFCVFFVSKGNLLDEVKAFGDKCYKTTRYHIIRKYT